MEVYPFHHRNLLFNIFTDLDLSFKEIREILDYLLDAQAFPKEQKDAASEGATIHDIRLGPVQYTVDVLGYEIIIYQRTEIQEP
jgi:hypothetical protein